MGEPTAYYVDPSIAANSGTGTSGDPYGDLQYALNSVTRNSTDGDIFHIKAGTDEVLSAALSTATYGTPAWGAPLIFAGYTTTAGDGGIGGISGGGSVAIYSGAGTGICFKDLHLHNSGSAVLLTLGQYCRVVNCELDNTTGNGVSIGNYSSVLACHLHNIGGIGVTSSSAGPNVCYNFFQNGTNDFTRCGYFTSNYGQFTHNIISVDGSTIGFEFAGLLGAVYHNSFLGGGSTGRGIYLNGNNSLLNNHVTNNLIEGFATGIESNAVDGNTCVVAGNSVYDCTTAYSLSDHSAMDFDNETLGATPFAKSGSDTYANRATYFAPADTGDVMTPFGGMGGARGAVQLSSGGGGGGSSATVVCRRITHHFHL